MSGVGEALAILAAIGGLAQAFKQGAELVAQIREKRRNKANPPPQLLDQSLSRGPKALEDAKRNGLDRFGPAFAAGDERALNELLKLEVLLRRSYTEDLVKAIKDDTFDDFLPTLDTSDITRVSAVTALNDLYMRILSQRNEADHRNHSSAPQSLPTPAETSQSREPPAPTSPTSTEAAHERPSGVTYLPEIGWFKKYRKSKTDTIGEESSPPPNPTRSADVARTSPLPGALNDVVPPPAGHPSRHDAVDEDVLEHNPWTETPMPVEIVSSVSRPRDRSDRVPLLRFPRAANDYLGFCRGACALQSGDEKGLRVEREMTFGNATFLMCRHCAFTCRIDRDRIWESKEDGVALRYDFLAKSHVEITKEQNHAYLCLFCILAGTGRAEIFQGYDFYFRHLARHRHDNFEERILERTRCIQGEVAGEDDDFDINLYPLDKRYD